MIVRNVVGQARYLSDKMGKVSLAAGDHLYAGMNCFAPGQEHKAHVHTDQDKMYLVVEGEGVATVGAETVPVAAGDLILAKAGVPHGLRNSSQSNFAVLVIFGPPPRQ